MKATVLKKSLCLLVALLMISTQTPVVYAIDETIKNQTLQIIKGDVYTYEVMGLTRVSVTDPEIADIADAQPDKILLQGKKPGQTILFVWDEYGKHVVTLNVVKEDLMLGKKRIDAILIKSGLNDVKSEVDTMEGKIVLSGKLKKEDKTKIERLLEPFAESVLDLTQEGESEELIQIDMQITELSTSVSKNLGFDWGTSSTDGPKPIIDYLESGLPTGGSKNWFKLGEFNRTAVLVNSINFLIQEGKARDLSRPRILVTSGKEATINVGGEIPTTSTTTDASGLKGQTNITFKQYGVTLTVTPTIKNGKIDIVMKTEVSDVDRSFYTVGGETNDIAYKTRSAQTQLMLDDRQTVVFAGLIRYSESEQVKRIPFLGKIPIIGALFRNKNNPTPNEGKELIITMTPTIMRTKEYVTEQLKMPSKKLIDFSNEVTKVGKYENEALPVIPTETAKSSAVAMDPQQMVINDYVRAVQQKIAGSISFPQEAIENNINGTVKLKLTIRNDGYLAGAVVSQTSGQDIFDQDALNTAKALVPYAKFSPTMDKDDLTVTIPIVYNQSMK